MTYDEHITYYGLLHAIHRTWKNIVKAEKATDNDEDYKLIDKLKDKKEPTKWLYQGLVKKKCIQPSKAIKKWLKDLNSETHWEEVMRENCKQR